MTMHISYIIYPPRVQPVFGYSVLVATDVGLWFRASGSSVLQVQTTIFLFQRPVCLLRLALLIFIELYNVAE